MKKTLYKVSDNKAVMGGVAQGLSEYFSIDVVLFRAIFIILFFTPFPSIITYFIMWAVLPQKPVFAIAGTNNAAENSNFEPTNLTTMNKSNQNGSFVGGAILITLGVIFSINEFFDVNVWHWIGKLWPLILVGLGVWMITKDRKEDNFNN